MQHIPKDNSDKESESTKQRNFLPIGYELGDNDVYCGRGSQCFNHIGNRRFRDIVLDNLSRYNLAMTKFEKSAIIYEVVETIRKESPNGGFVKKDLENGQYYEVGDFHAVSRSHSLRHPVYLIVSHDFGYYYRLQREKTSQAFRDLTKGKYKSSKFAKSRKNDRQPLVSCFENQHSSNRQNFSIGKFMGMQNNSNSLSLDKIPFQIRSGLSDHMLDTNFCNEAIRMQVLSKSNGPNETKKRTDIMVQKSINSVKDGPSIVAKKDCERHVQNPSLTSQEFDALTFDLLVNFTNRHSSVEM
jgi:hypothetical protein